VMVTSRVHLKLLGMSKTSWKLLSTSSFCRINVTILKKLNQMRLEPQVCSPICEHVVSIQYTACHVIGHLLSSCWNVHWADRLYHK
jgi:hypothetical protein